MNQEAESDHAEAETDKPEVALFGQHGDGADGDGDLEHGDATGKELMGAEKVFGFLLQVFGFFLDGFLVGLVFAQLVLSLSEVGLPRAARISILLLSCASLMLLDWK